MLAIREEVVLGMATDRFHQALLKLALQQPYNLANSLKREAAAAKIADHGNFRKIVETVQTPMSFARRDHDLALVPPLQLAGADAGQPNHLRGCEPVSHLSETFLLRNV